MANWDAEGAQELAPHMMEEGGFNFFWEEGQAEERADGTSMDTCWLVWRRPLAEGRVGEDELGAKRPLWVEINPPKPIFLLEFPPGRAH